jgi:hypothetical protein
VQQQNEIDNGKNEIDNRAVKRTKTELERTKTIRHFPFENEPLMKLK